MVYANESDYKLLAGEKNLGLYQFHTHTAKHYFCKTCAIYRFHKTRIKPGMFGFNAGCLEGVDVTALDVIIVHGAKR
ncbi:MAG: hypothetical protein V7784_08735 [Oceanospirillaceae bacterium]